MTRKMLAAAGTAAVLGAALMASAGTAGAERPDMCVAAGGGVRMQHGTADCSVGEGTGNVAIARGPEAYAVAGDEATDERNKAMATGDSAQAFAYAGGGNKARATGDSAFASAGRGDGNTARATGDGSIASAFVGDDNTARATGDGSVATAYLGDGNRATATDGQYACAGNGGSDETAVNEDLCS